MAFTNRSDMTRVLHRSPDLMKCEEHLARLLAARMGQESIAARALAELDERRARGEKVCIFPDRGEWLVGPA